MDRVPADLEVKAGRGARVERQLPIADMPSQRRGDRQPELARTIVGYTDAVQVACLDHYVLQSAHPVHPHEPEAVVPGVGGAQKPHLAEVAADICDVGGFEAHRACEEVNGLLDVRDHKHRVAQALVAGDEVRLRPAAADLAFERELPRKDLVSIPEGIGVVVQ
ncbi:hypothetical protein O1M63_17525 [Streptomyces mirabilis]|nr:hypothetical protein [Streptomyces mirabilis]